MLLYSRIQTRKENRAMLDGTVTKILGLRGTTESSEFKEAGGVITRERIRRGFDSQFLRGVSEVGVMSGTHVIVITGSDEVCLVANADQAWEAVQKLHHQASTILRMPINVWSDVAPAYSADKIHDLTRQPSRV